jgi:hypothetical protein
MSNPLFLSGREVLHLIRWRGKHPRSALWMLRRNGLPCHRIMNRYLYPREAVIAWVMSQQPTVYQRAKGSRR